jgi:hypothetical protein
MTAFAVRLARGTGTLAGVSATFIFLMLGLKIPIFGLLYIVWYAIKSPPEPEPIEDDGGTKRPLSPRPRPRHPRPALPRNPRRGPHGAPQVPAPPRVRQRTLVARARPVERHR